MLVFKNIENTDRKVVVEVCDTVFLSNLRDPATNFSRKFVYLNIYIYIYTCRKRFYVNFITILVCWSNIFDGVTLSDHVP